MLSLCKKLINRNAISDDGDDPVKNDKDTTEDDLPTFKRFEDNFKWITFGLVVNMMYPKKRNLRQQTLLTRIIVGTILSGFILCMYSMVISAKQEDLYNSTRQLAMIFPFFLMMAKVHNFLIKMLPCLQIVFANVKKELFQSIIDEINSDYIEANTMKNPEYIAVMKSTIEKGKFVEVTWACNSLAVVGSFPLYATVNMLKHNFVRNEQKKIMLHELILPVFNDHAHSTPLFQIVFIYSLVICFFCLTNFLGFDASFCVAASHCRGQLQIMTMRLRNLFCEEGLDGKRLIVEMGNIVRQHQKIFRFSEKMQAMYSDWMGWVVSLTSMQICLTVFQLTEALKVNEVRMEFIVFTIGSVVQVYMPCWYGSILTNGSSQSAIDIYCCGWEKVKDPRIRSTLRMMIARAQKPITFTAIYLMPINMETFISIINTSYSYFTILRSGD